MRKIKIVTDSSCDLNSEIIQKYNIEIVPLNVSFGDKIYEDGYIEKSEFYEMMDKSPVLPKTSCPSPEKFIKSYEGEEDEILVITLAAKLSGTYSTAVLAKKMFEEEHPTKKVAVIDTQTGSIGQGLLIVKAAQLDNYDEMFKRFSNMTAEAFNEKADLIVQIMSIGGEITPNGQPLIPAELMQQGIIDVLDDNGDLSTVEQIFATYEEYQTQITALKNQMAANEQKAIIDNAVNSNTQLQDQMLQGVANMQQQAQEENALNEVLSSMGL